jgi:hypothetical protein
VVWSIASIALNFQFISIAFPVSATGWRVALPMVVTAKRPFFLLIHFQAFFLYGQTLYGSYFPKVDPALIHDLLIRMQADPEKTPFYMVEIFTKPGTDSEAMRDYILQKTGMVPAIYDNGTHYVVNQRLTLEFLKELSDSERIIDVSGDYTGAVTGRGASRESRGIEHKD